MRVALTVAGSDSGGGAGIQADLKTFARFGVFGTSVITAVTAQNTRGVTAWEAVSPALVRAQLEAVLGDLPPAALKTGMLGSTDVVRTVVDVLREYLQRDTVPVIVDPVMVASTGALLLDANAVRGVRDELIPLATLVTPNLDEAKVLLGDEIRDEDQMRRAAERLVRELGAKAALVKGGHGSGETVVDVLYDGDWYVQEHPRQHSASTHGTGCTLSAAIVAQLALGTTLRDAVDVALTYVQRAMMTAPGLGSGDGPLNHFA
jgi:hydroxymethylpyrimidine/phosphomethylpyrimidine kinase